MGCCFCCWLLGVCSLTSLVLHGGKCLLSKHYLIDCQRGWRTFQWWLQLWAVCFPPSLVVCERALAQWEAGNDRRRFFPETWWTTSQGLTDHLWSTDHRVGNTLSKDRGRQCWKCFEQLWLLFLRTIPLPGPQILICFSFWRKGKELSRPLRKTFPVTKEH